MRTVKELKKELEKFPDDAMCYGYEGEDVGIAISKDGKCGFIYCGESNCKEPDTEEFLRGHNQ